MSLMPMDASADSAMLRRASFHGYAIRLCWCAAIFCATLYAAAQMSFLRFCLRHWGAVDYYASRYVDWYAITLPATLMPLRHAMLYFLSCHITMAMGVQRLFIFRHYFMLPLPLHCHERSMILSFSLYALIEFFFRCLRWFSAPDAMAAVTLIICRRYLLRHLLPITLLAILDDAPMATYMPLWCLIALCFSRYHQTCLRHGWLLLRARERRYADERFSPRARLPIDYYADTVTLSMRAALLICRRLRAAAYDGAFVIDIDDAAARRSLIRYTIAGAAEFTADYDWCYVIRHFAYYANISPPPAQRARHCLLLLRARQLYVIYYFVAAAERERCCHDMPICYCFTLCCFFRRRAATMRRRCYYCQLPRLLRLLRYAPLRHYYFDGYFRVADGLPPRYAATPAFIAARAAPIDAYATARLRIDDCRCRYASLWAAEMPMMMRHYADTMLLFHVADDAYFHTHADYFVIAIIDAFILPHATYAVALSAPLLWCHVYAIDWWRQRH